MSGPQRSVPQSLRNVAGSKARGLALRNSVHEQSGEGKAKGKIDGQSHETFCVGGGQMPPEGHQREEIPSPVVFPLVAEFSSFVFSLCSPPETGTALGLSFNLWTLFLSCTCVF